MTPAQRKKFLTHAASLALLWLATITACSVKPTETNKRHAAGSPTAATADAAQATLKIPDSIPPVQSPFAKTKIFMASSAALTDSNGTESVSIIYKDIDTCAKSVAALPGFVETTRLFNGEYSATVVVQPHDDYAALAAKDCIIGIADNPNFPMPPGKSLNGTASLGLAGSSPKDIVGLDPTAQAFFAGVSQRVKVAIVDTGIDLTNPSLSKSITKDLRTTSAFVDAKSKSVVYGDLPTDENGHGTEVASVIAHQDFGLAPKNVEIIPIKVTQGETFSGSLLLAGINEAVNKGAEVISLSVGGDSLGCNPAVGYVIQRAIEKGVFFVVAAGNGNSGVGYPVVAARDDGPASYLQTFTSACWSRYFLGVVSVAALDEGATTLAPFSNFGDDLELSAPGTNIPVVQLQNINTQATGTSLAVPFVTSAAALAIAHHRGKGLSYAPWYIENLLVESANKDVTQAAQNKRVRLGSVVNFANLATLLKKAEAMTDDQRRNDIKTISPRDGTGWTPGTDVANLRLLRVDMLKDVGHPGETMPYKVTAFYRDNTQADVTANHDTTITLSNTQMLRIEAPGVIRVKDAATLGFSTPTDSATFAVTANYSEKQAQVYNTASFLVASSDTMISSIHIVPPTTPLRIGQTVNQFHLMGKTPKGDDIEITGATLWSASAPKEFVFIKDTGVADLSPAVSGKTYTVTAVNDGATYNLDVTLVDESVSTFQIHSYLGLGAVLEVGQKLVIEPHFILNQTREVALPGLWYLNGKQTGDTTPSVSLTIDTTGMAAGTYSLRSVATFRHVGGDKDFEDIYQFKIGDAIDHIAIEQKDTIVTIGQDFQIDLRSYLLNNSYAVVTSQTTWTTDHPDLVKINSAGIGHLDSKLTAGTVKITAHYMNRDATTSIQAVAISAVTGSSSDLDHVDMQLSFGGFCGFPAPGKIVAVYKDGSTRDQIAQSTSVSHLNPAGQWEDATLPVFGGHTYRVSVTYNDGNKAVGGGGNAVVSKEITLPVVPLDALPFISNYDKRSLVNSPLKANLNAVDFETAETTAHGICGLTSAKVTPADIPVRPANFTVGYTPTKVGKYTVLATAAYTGGGTAQILSGSFDIEIGPAKPTSLTLTPSSVPGKTAVGVLQTFARLLDEGQKDLTIGNGDIVYQIYVDGIAIDKSDNRVRVLDNYTTQAHFALYPRTTAGSYKIIGTHVKTGLHAEISFDLVASWEVNTPAESLMPSITPPAINNVDDVACTTQGVSQAMSGKGTKDVPYVICNEADFAAIKTYQKTSTSYFRLGRNFDFAGRAIHPTDVGPYNIFLDGGGRSLANYVIVDSEHDDMGFFTGNLLSVSNLVIVNPTVRGRGEVGSLAGSSRLYNLNNVAVIGGTVWGAAGVGGLFGSSARPGGMTFTDIGVYGTTVRFDLGGAGGVAGGISGPGTVNRWIFTGTVESAGVPGANQNVGGLLGGVEQIVVKNSLVTGYVSSLNATNGDTNVGGLIGSSIRDTEIYDSEFSGLVVSTGSGVGGIIGSMVGSHNFALGTADALILANGDNLGAYRLSRHGGVLVRNKVSGGVWGGMSREQLKCLDDSELVVVLGVGGSVSCTGDILSQSGGYSDVGGIVGIGTELTIQDNVFSGKARGITSVGGIAGSVGIGNFVRNTVSGVVSGSSGVKEYGALVGAVRNPNYLALVPSRFDSNKVLVGSGIPTWTIGNNLGILQQAILTNVPDVYPQK